MSPPLKPLDANSRLLRAASTSGPVPQSSCSSIPGVKIQGVAAVPPPLPPRQHVNHTPSVYGTGYSPMHSLSMYGGYGGYGGGYSGFGGGFSGLGGYGPSSYGYNTSYGMPFRGGYNGRSLDDTESRFLQMAEESSRPAFQSIESIVRTFASVTMMLESTFHAMHTSFHAVLGVAENFDRLRQLSLQVAKYMSALAMLRTIYWFYRRILYMLGLIKTHPSSEDVWSAAERSIVGPGQNEQPATTIRSTWPVITFFGLLFGGPFVIYKLISSLKGSDKKEDQWDPRTHESQDVVMLYRFRAANDRELNAEAGERLKIPAEKYIKDNSGWITAVNQNNRIGLVPLNHLGRISKRQSLSSIPETVSSVNSVEDNRNLVSANRTNTDEKQGCESNTISNSNVSPVVVSINKSSSDCIQKKTEEKNESS